MINVNQAARANATAQNAEQRQISPAHSAAPTVIELFQKRLRTSDQPSTPAQTGDTLSPTQQRVEALLRHSAADGQPSLAAHINERVQSAQDPLSDSTLSNDVERLLNQPSALNPQKTYAQLIDEIIKKPPPSASSVTTTLSRGRRDLQGPAPMQDTRNTATRQFADALVNKGDQQLAIHYANHLIRMWVYPGSYSLGGEQIAVPPGSTFGLAWTELADALSAEPFKTFAKTKAIDISSLVIKANGDLTGLADYEPFSFSLAKDSDWAVASSAVLAAAKKMSSGDLRFQDRAHSPAQQIADFYGERPSHFNNDDRLYDIRQLSKRGFRTLSNTDSYYASRYAPFKQRQREAKQKITNLPAQQLNQLLEPFTPTTAAQKVKDADKALAQMCSQELAQGYAEMFGEIPEFSFREIPEYSTFHLARENLKQALSGSDFYAFVQDNHLELDSIQIDSSDGTLYGEVNGIETTFTLNDISGWADVWLQVQDATKLMAGGGTSYVEYPSTLSATRWEVHNFYAEHTPKIYYPEDGWRLKAQNERFRISAELTRNGGFKALADTSSSVWKAQEFVTRQLAGKPLNLSPLETLAAAVKTSMQNVPPPAPDAESPEDAMASAESALAVSVQRAMLELKNDPANASSKLIDAIPANTQFGQWWAHLGKALKGRGLTEWAQKRGIDPASLQYDPAEKVLIGKVAGADQRFDVTDFATKYPDQFDAISHVVTAAEALVPNGKPILLSHGNGRSASFECVANFYGIDTRDYNSTAFASTAEQMGRTQSFPERPEIPAQRLNWLNRQKNALGDSNNRYALVDTLKGPNYSVDARKIFRVDPDSSHQPKGPTTRDTFIANQGWYPINSLAQTQNLLLALQTPAPQSPALGNHWGFLSTDLPLSTEQRSTVAEHVKASIGNFATLISYLSAQVADINTDPKEALAQLLASDKAIELATRLQTKMKGASTPTSLKQWLLTALVLELDPTAGTQHKTVAGVDLMGVDNSGRSARSIYDRLNQHLAAQRNIPVDLAPIASHLLLSGTAPQLLVKEVPKEVTLGSPAWFNFTAAVNQIEWMAPGATASMTYQQVMDQNKIQPISTLETQVQSYAQMNPLLDWAALNNNVDKNNYTLEQLKDSQQKLQSQVANTAEAIRWLSTNQAPNRRDMALKVLREKFGSDIDYEKRVMVENEFAGVISGGHYSLVEIYEAGRLDENWMQDGNHVDFDSLRKKATEAGFPVINDEFDKAIKEDFNLRRRHTATLFKDMIRNLPVEERKSLLYGDVEFLNVDGADGSGMVITSIYNGVRRDFAAYPSRGQIVRITDIDPSTPLGKTVSLEIDAAAFKNGTEPKPGTKSDVVLRTTDQHLLDDNNEPWPLEVSFPAHKENDAFSPSYVDGRISKLASVMIVTVRPSHLPSPAKPRHGVHLNLSGHQF